MEKYKLLQESGSECAVYNDIPFAVRKEGQNIQPIELKDYQIDAPDYYSYLFLLGMTTSKTECSEWWGSDEYWHNHSKRLFVGDLMGHVRIVYESNKSEFIPLLYGVNIWSYELITPLKPYETQLNPFEGPFEEPFLSDKKAKKLLDDSLLLNPVPDGDKGSRYILSIKLDETHKVKMLYFFASGKDNKPFITSFTLAPKGFVSPLKKQVDYLDFMRKSYLWMNFLIICKIQIQNYMMKTIKKTKRF